MGSQSIASSLIVAGLVLAAASSASAETHKMAGHPAAKVSGDQALIASAMTAAPKAVSSAATVMQMGADGKMRTLRKGTNNFTCIPDDPTTPGPDPMCFDPNAGEFIMALSAHKPPPQKTGFMYMLAGGTDASNTDPYATKPTGKNHWIKTGPHVMIVGDPSLLAGYPSSPDPNTAAPYVMWAGTPYAHLMVPVK